PRAPLYPHSFPTRRSSDLGVRGVPALADEQPPGARPEEGTVQGIDRGGRVHGGGLRTADHEHAAGDEGVSTVRKPKPECITKAEDRKSTRLNSSHQIISYA